MKPSTYNAADHPHHGRNPTRLRAGGFSLITTLILLVVVTILGIGASQMVLLSERSTRFDRDQQIAFQAAEAALLDAEFDIRGPNTKLGNRMALFTGTEAGNISFIDACAGSGASTGLCTGALVGNKPVWYAVDFADNTATARSTEFGQFTDRTFSTGNSGIRPERLPRYIVEVLPDNTPGQQASGGNKKVLYRVTAMGFGPRIDTQAVVQMIFRKE